jgi:hypothetical protein
MPVSTQGGMARRVLLGPDVVARAASRGVSGRDERWMLCQPRGVRESYVREVLDRGDHALHQQIWMLRQAKAVRESYVREVLEPELNGGG